ncbi:MAG: MobA/MobL family protein [Oscillospiraceae bacterium]|nr:MobA/MobL family protein [Oscillospiraceae bacterium]
MHNYIVSEFVNSNFTEHNLCSIAAIHRGEYIYDPSRNNPHVHIVVSTRTIDADGFSKKKFREYDKPIYLMHWREHWANIQNRAYERNGLDIHVSHESLEKQGIDREPVKHLSLIDWQKELRGEHTEAGDENRLIRKRNQERSRQAELQRELESEIDIYR